jgi:hypothetical protein
MGKQPDFLFDETSGICSCSIILNDFLQGFGLAQCAEEDADVISERTGMTIAEYRAQINLLQNFKNRELYPGLKALQHLKSTMVNSKKYNPDSYEAKRLEKEIKHYQEDIKDTCGAIEVAKQILYDYINAREHLNARLRAGDHAGYKDEDSEMLQKDIDVYERIKNDNQT